MEKQHLSGEWSLKDLHSGESITACVPGDITVDFYRAGVIADPYYGMNYKSERYLLERDYEYEKVFSAKRMQGDERCFLVFDGIDTFAEIYLNGTLLGKTENMFLRYEYDITDRLQEKNRLCVRMRSTLKRAEKIDAEKYFACFNKERIFLRKAQCHFGWDWAPDLPGYGIYGEVFLSYRPRTAIENVRCVTDAKGNVTLFTQLNYNVRTEEWAHCAGDTLRYTVESTPCGGFGKAVVSEFSVSGAKNFRSLKIENPALWMPVGYGQPNLYAYKVELVRGGKVIDCYEGRLGLREVKLIEAPSGEDTLSFRLEVNGVDVFVKGSNWVPCECFTGTASDERYQKLVGLAAQAGFNMLRVWGGGIYERDLFYRLCDELGVMVWQDFMFACADIPENDADFVKNVTEECIYQVKRLRNHPSLVYWCGGNEKTGSCGLLKQYGDFLVDVTLRGIVDHYDGTRPYVRQSPYSRTDVGNDSESGETHGAAFDPVTVSSLEEFYKLSYERRVSFASECAIMGSCVPQSYRNFVPEKELWPLGELYEDRFCDNPYGAIMSFVQRQLRTVELLFGKAEGIDEFAVKSMAVQAEELKIEVCNARRKRASCGGFLNWMYNDIWPTGTWSVVDYYLQPKAAYYTLKREYAPVRGMIVPDGEGRYFAYIVNDTVREIEAVTMIGGAELGGVYRKAQKLRVVLQPCSVLPLGEVSAQGDVLYLDVTAEGQTQTAHIFTKPFKELAFASDYTVRVSESERRGDVYVTQAAVTANQFVRMAHIEADGDIVLSDDWFDVLPGRTKGIELISEKPLKNVTVSDYTKYTVKHYD